MVVSLYLSHDSDRIKVEEAFSLTEDNKTLQGSFEWEGKRLVFRPAAPLEINADYCINLGTGAQDERGLSLEKKFVAPFTTRPDVSRPKILFVEPAYDAILAENLSAVRIGFSREVTVNSCVNWISFSPSMKGHWRLEDGNCTACFIPAEPWETGRQYLVKITSAFLSSTGVRLGTDFSSRFSIGEDQEAPVLAGAFAEYDGESAALEAENLSGTVAVYDAWEHGTVLKLDFSEPVDMVSLTTHLVCEPSLGLELTSEMQTGAVPETFVSTASFRLLNRPGWQSEFLFRLSPGVKDRYGNESTGEYVFHIRFAGPRSKPPALAGIRLPMAPGEATQTLQLPSFYTTQDLFKDLPITGDPGHYPHDTGINSWVELYFDLAQDTHIDLFSVMDLFRVDATNSAIAFSPRSIRNENFTWPQPEEGWEDYERIEIRGVLTNSTNSGIAGFRIESGLRDARGNVNTEAFRIPLLK
jgi:hypothetical protein